MMKIVVTKIIADKDRGNTVRFFKEALKLDSSNLKSFSDAVDNKKQHRIFTILYIADFNDFNREIIF